MIHSCKQRSAVLMSYRGRSHTKANSTQMIPVDSLLEQEVVTSTLWWLITHQTLFWLNLLLHSRKDKHTLKAYNTIMERLKAKGLTVDLQVLDNDTSKELKKTITQEWKVEYQLVPLDVHRRNAAERAIRTFKAHFLSILVGVDQDFPSNVWDSLVPQAEMMLNILRQSSLDPSISAYEQFNGELNYDATPLGPWGISVITQKKHQE